MELDQGSWRTVSYVVYERKTGRVVHLHREVTAGPAAGRSESELLKALKPHLPAGADVGALRTDESTAPVAGTQLFVDVRAHTVMRVRTPSTAPRRGSTGKAKTGAKKGKRS